MQWSFLYYLLLAGTCQSLSSFTRCTSIEHHVCMTLAATKTPSASLSYKRSAIEVSDHGFEENAMLGSEKLLYMDDDIVVIDKAFYSRTVPSQHVSDSAAVTVMHTLGLDRVDQLIVHRLDYATSGIVLFARNLNALRYLHKLFRTGHSIQKRYKAIVSGVPSSFEGEIDLPLGKDLEKGSPFCKVDVTERGKHSLTQWRLAAVADDRRHSMLDLLPKTGRYRSLALPYHFFHKTHQLRLHLAAIGHPIVGDHFYAPSEVADQSHRLLLHAEELILPHPRTQYHMAFRARCPFNIEDL